MFIFDEELKSFLCSDHSNITPSAFKASNEDFQKHASVNSLSHNLKASNNILALALPPEDEVCSDSTYTGGENFEKMPQVRR